MKFVKQTITAHRGASGLVEHENTIESFLKAIEVKADAIELDIRQTKDGKIVVVHNPDYNNKKISEYTYVELCETTSKSNFIMPLLEEVLITCKGKIFIDIEMKEKGYVKKTVDLIKKHLTTDEFYIRSFHDEVLIEIKQIDSNIKTVLLIGEEKPKHVILTRIREVFPYRRAKKCKCDMVSPNYQLIILWYVQRLHFHGIPVLAWTLNSEKLIRKYLFKKKVDGVITNYPDIAYKVLNK